MVLFRLARNLPYVAQLQTSDCATRLLQESQGKLSYRCRLTLILTSAQVKPNVVRLVDHTMWQSSNKGYSWTQIHPGHRFLVFYHHKYSDDRGYVITDINTFYTMDTGRTWNQDNAPTPPNAFGAQVIHFHLTTDKLVWTGNRGCSAQARSGNTVLRGVVPRR